MEGTGRQASPATPWQVYMVMISHVFPQGTCGRYLDNCALEKGKYPTILRTIGHRVQVDTLEP